MVQGRVPTTRRLAQLIDSAGSSAEATPNEWSARLAAWRKRIPNSATRDGSRFRTENKRHRSNKHVRKLSLFVLLWFSASFCARAESILPLSPGITWEYHISNSDGGSSSMTVRAISTEKSADKELVRLETRANDSVIQTEDVATETHGIFCYRRAWPGKQDQPLDPPQLKLPDQMSVGTKWDTDESTPGTDAHLRFNVVAEEEVAVPAGTFHAFRAECEQPWPISATIKRWFVPGVGLVKDVTSIRGPGGRLLNRATTALTKFSRGNPAPPEPGPSVTVHANSPASMPNFTLEVAREREGAPVDEIKSDAPNIFVRWHGENVPIDSMVRIAWVATDVGDLVSPNFIIDETTMRVTTSPCGTRFTLSRPKDGWASGKYRVDLYLDDQLSASSAVTIRD